VTAELAAALAAEDDAIGAALTADDLTGYRPLLRGSRSVNRIWDDVSRPVRHYLRQFRRDS
jgi:hypothetical protein